MFRLMISVMVLMGPIFSYSFVVNYHSRVVYYDQNQNCCRRCATVVCDNIMLEINFDDRPKVERRISGETNCDDYFYQYSNKVSPHRAYCYVEEYVKFFENRICFDQQINKVRYRDIVLLVVLESTVSNPIRWENTTYNCEIHGNDKDQHFGPYQDYPLPKIELFCKKSKQTS